MKPAVPFSPSISVNGGPAACLLAVFFAPTLASAQNPTPPDSQKEKPAKQETYLFGAQSTFIFQYLFPFHSPYVGPNSLPSISQGRLSDTYTLYLGARAAQGLEFYVDPELARGGGIGNALGLAGYTNGDVIRNPQIGQTPYLARYFVRYTVPTGPGQENVDKGENQIAGVRPTHRLVLTAGKLGTNDIFDLNRYADSTRTQFMNWTLINNAAYDYAADTRGYSIGAAAEWIEPNLAFRIGSFEMPTVANGTDLDQKLGDNHGDQAEFELHPAVLRRKPPAVFRLLAYRNIADMGDYRQALQATTPPNIVSTRAPGRQKYGFGLNLEQPLGDDGDSGLFARLGWDDGATESFAYTECDDTISFGAQFSGKRWRSTPDLLGVALVTDGLSAPHREYLAAGGQGFLLGDGKLNYGRETVLESYYQRQFNKYASVAFDLQCIANPGYNQSRGPLAVPSLRLHFEF